jgi:RNA polymerase sigma-70 factor (ECF subfamily)
MAALDSLLFATGNDPDISAYQAEVRRLVRVAMDYLPSLYADALEAKYVNDLPVNEIAVLIGKSPKATESVLTRAREAFRESFKSLMNNQEAIDGPQSISSLLEY